MGLVPASGVRAKSAGRRTSRRRILAAPTPLFLPFSRVGGLSSSSPHVVGPRVGDRCVDGASDSRSSTGQKPDSGVNR